MASPDSIAIIPSLFGGGKCFRMFNLPITAQSGRHPDAHYEPRGGFAEVASPVSEGLVGLRLSRRRLIRTVYLERVRQTRALPEYAYHPSGPPAGPAGLLHPPFRQRQGVCAETAVLAYRVRIPRTC